MLSGVAHPPLIAETTADALAEVMLGLKVTCLSTTSAVARTGWYWFKDRQISGFDSCRSKDDGPARRQHVCHPLTLGTIFQWSCKTISRDRYLERSEFQYRFDYAFSSFRVRVWPGFPLTPIGIASLQQSRRLVGSGDSGCTGLDRPFPQINGEKSPMDEQVERLVDQTWSMSAG